MEGRFRYHIEEQLKRLRKESFPIVEERPFRAALAFQYWLGFSPSGRHPWLPDEFVGFCSPRDERMGRRHMKSGGQRGP